MRLRSEDDAREVDHRVIERLARAPLVDPLLTMEVVGRTTAYTTRLS